MTDRNNRPGKIHQGRNIKRFREMRGIKQEVLAHKLGEDWSQKRPWKRPYWLRLSKSYGSRWKPFRILMRSRR